MPEPSRGGVARLVGRAVWLIVATMLVGAGQCELLPSPAAETSTPSPASLAQGSPSQTATWIAPSGVKPFRPLVERPVISTLAGTGDPAGGGGSTNALEVGLGGPSGIAVDLRGNVYVADSTDSVIWKIDSQGKISRFAGSLERGFSGDGGPAVLARLTDPSSLVADGSGAIYFAALDRIRRVGAEGIIQTVAGTGVPGFAGDAGPAGAASFNGNAGMAIDAAGNLYIADRGNGRIRRIDQAGMIRTVAGTGEERSSGDGGPAIQAGLNRPVDVAVGPDGSIYVAELAGHRIRRIDPAGKITTIAGNGTPGFSGDGGAAVDASLNSPRAVAVDSDANLYVASWRTRVIRRVTPAGTIQTIAGMGSIGTLREGFSAFAAALAPPLDLELGPSGEAYVVTQGTRKVHALKAPEPGAAASACAGAPLPPSPRPRPGDKLLATIVAGQAGSGYAGDGGPASEAKFLIPQSFAIGKDGRAFIADTGNHRIRVILPDGRVANFAGTSEAGYAGDGGKADQARISAPKALAVDGQGNLYFFDSGNFRIRRVDTCGVIETLAGTGIPGSRGDGGPAIAAEIRDPSGIAVDGRGNILVADPASNVVRLITPDGNILSFAGTGQAASGPDGGPAAATPLDGPTDVAVAPDGTIFIAEQRAGKLRAVGAAGLIRTVLGPGAPDSKPEGPASTVRLVDPAALLVDREGNVYVAQLTAGLVSVLSAGGSVKTVAGNPAGTGVSGDSALEVAIPAPVDLDLDGGGNLYVLESAGILWQIGGGAGRLTPSN